jgi:hypothetical protein
MLLSDFNYSIYFIYYFLEDFKLICFLVVLHCSIYLVYHFCKHFKHGSLYSFNYFHLFNYCFLNAFKYMRFYLLAICNCSIIISLKCIQIHDFTLELFVP